MYYYLPCAGDDVFFSMVGSKDRFLIVDDSSRVLFDSLFLKKIVSRDLKNRQMSQLLKDMIG